MTLSDLIINRKITLIKTFPDSHSQCPYPLPVNSLNLIFFVVFLSGKEKRAEQDFTSAGHRTENRRREGDFDG